MGKSTSQLETGIKKCGISKIILAVVVTERISHTGESEEDLPSS
jgi:hypothetical protein